MFTREGMYCKGLVLPFVATVGVLVGALTPAHADMVYFFRQGVSHQDANNNAYLSWDAAAYQAETIRVSGNTRWTPVSDGNALSGTALYAASGSNGSAGANSNIVTYNLQFSTPGTYALYFRARAGQTPVGSADSWFAPTGAFGDDQPSLSMNAYGTSNLVRLGGTSSGENFSTSYQWFRQGGTANNRIEFLVTADNVANGDLLTFSVGAREDHTVMDRWILSTNPNLFNASAGDTAAKLSFDFSTAPLVPEPSSALLLLVAVLGLALTRRRTR